VVRPQREHDVRGRRRVDGRAERLSELERANQHDVRGRRRVDGKPERVSDREVVNQSAARIFTRAHYYNSGPRTGVHTES